MVEDRDAYELSGLDEASGDFVVLVGGLETTTGMVVCHDDCRGVVDDGPAEDLRWMDEAAVDDADGHSAHRGDAVCTVETEREEVLPATGSVAFQNLLGVRRGADGHFEFDPFL